MIGKNSPFKSAVILVLCLLLAAIVKKRFWKERPHAEPNAGRNGTSEEWGTWIEQWCLNASYRQGHVYNTRNLLAEEESKLQDHIDKKNLKYCAVVKVAAKEWKNPSEFGMKCEEGKCFLTPSIEYPIYFTKDAFWTHNFFVVTNHTWSLVDKNPKLSNFKCVGTNRISGLSVCVNKKIFTRESKDEYVFHIYDFVTKHFAEELEAFTVLPAIVAQKINCKRIPLGLSVYYKNGKKFDCKSELYGVWVVREPEKITADLVNFINHVRSYRIKGACDLLGFRMLSDTEIKHLANLKKNPRCFFVKNKIVTNFKDLNFNDSVYVASWDTGKAHKPANANEIALQELLFANQKSIFFSNNITQVPENWIQLSHGIFLKKGESNSLTFKTGNITEIINSNQTRLFLETNDSFIVAYQWGHKTRFDFGSYFESDCVFGCLIYSKLFQKRVVETELGKSHLVHKQLLMTWEGFIFLVRYAKFPENVTSFEINAAVELDENSCNQELEKRNYTWTCECNENTALFSNNESK